MIGEKSIKEAMEKTLHQLEQIWKMITLPINFFSVLSLT